MAGAPHQKVCEADASLDVVQLVAEPMRPRLPSTARTMMLLRMSARKASYQALRTTSSRSASAAPDLAAQPWTRSASPRRQPGRGQAAAQGMQLKGL